MLRIYEVDGLLRQYEEGEQPSRAVLVEPKKAQPEQEQPKQKAKTARNKSVQAQTK